MLQRKILNCFQGCLGLRQGQLSNTSCVFQNFLEEVWGTFPFSQKWAAGGGTRSPDLLFSCGAEL